MKRVFFRFLYLLLVLSVAAFKLNAQNIKADAGLQQSSLKIGEQTRLVLTVHQPVKAQVVFPKIGDSIVSKVQVVSSTKPDTVADKANSSNITITKAYTITCFDAGTYTIPAYLFTSGGQIVQTEPLTMQVISVAVDTTKAIYDIKQPLTVTYTFWDWLKDNWIWVLAGIAIIAAIIAAIYYFKKRPKPEPVITEPVKPSLPAYQVALNQLQALRDKKLWQQNEVKQYYIELTDVLRDYLENRYFIKTHEKTSDELLASLQSNEINADNTVHLKELLVLADLVKFAKFKPLPNENEQTLESAINFVVNTKPAETSKPAEGGVRNV